MKKILLGFIAIIFVLGATAIFITRNTPASHPNLKTSDLPPLIPTRAFYADPRSKSAYVASSDGKYVSFEKASLTGRSIVVKSLEANKEFAEFPVGLGHIRWHPSKPLLRFIFEGNDWEADPFAPERENWKRTSPVKLSGGWVKNQIAADDDMPILTFGKSHSRWPGHMWLVSQDGLVAEKVAKGDSNSLYWVFDEDIKSVLRMDSLDSATTRLFKRTATGWNKLIDVSLNDDFDPLSRVRNDGTVIVRSSRGRDKAALVAFDIETGQESILVENPKADIGWTIALTADSQEPDIVELGNNTLNRVALTERGQVFLDILDQFQKPVSLGATSPTASGRYVTQALSSQSKSYIYLLIDLQEKSYVTLGEYHFRRFKERLVQEQAVTFQARDGLSIPAVLTLPKGTTGSIPFIVHIHGGPAGHTELGYGRPSILG